MTRSNAFLLVGEGQQGFVSVTRQVLVHKVVEAMSSSRCVALWPGGGNHDDDAGSPRCVALWGGKHDDGTKIVARAAVHYRRTRGLFGCGAFELSLSGVHVSEVVVHIASLFSIPIKVGGVAAATVDRVQPCITCVT